MRQLTRLLRYVAPYWWQLLSSVLLMAAFDITISQGWPRGWWVGCVVTNILSAPASLPFVFQSLRIAFDSCGRLSKRH